MIHLKRFNENLENYPGTEHSGLDWELYLIRKFCYDSLSYLLDNKNINIVFDYSHKTNIYTIKIKDINSRWCDIEPDICPFLELSEEKYSLVNIISNNQIEIKNDESYKLWYSVSEILSGGVDDSSNILGIRLGIRI